MATRITKNVERIVQNRPHGELVVTLTAEGLTIRELGKRLTVGPFEYGRLFIRGVDDMVVAQKKRKPRRSR